MSACRDQALWKTILLPEGQEVRWPESYAELLFGPEITHSQIVRQGVEFTPPFEPSRVFQLVNVTEDSAKVRDGGREFVLDKTNRP